MCVTSLARKLKRRVERIARQRPIAARERGAAAEVVVRVCGGPHDALSSIGIQIRKLSDNALRDTGVQFVSSPKDLLSDRIHFFARFASIKRIRYRANESIERI